MKKLLLVCALCAVLALTLSLSIWIGAASDELHVTDTTSLAAALEQAPDNGTVVIDGTYVIPSDFVWPTASKTVTITGGILDFSNWGNNAHLKVNTGVIFSSIELKFATIDWNADNNEDATAKSDGSFPRTNIYANGHPFTVAADVTFTSYANTNVCLFGGSHGETVNGDTNLTVLAGTYTYLFGGGHGGKVNGDTHLTVGGSVNSNAKTSNHDSNYNAYGGGWDDQISGSTYLVIQDNAKMIHARGGSHGGSSKIGGYTNALVTGGDLMNLNGANKSVNTGLGAEVTVTGGKIQQIFGASESASFGSTENPVTVNVRVLGGEITRRIYGGCYNEFQNGNILEIVFGNLGKWTSTYQVYGDITMIISDQCNISYSYSEGLTTADKALYAGSRLSTYRSTGAIPEHEQTEILFLNTYQSAKLGAQDNTMQSIMSSVTAVADEIHTYAYVASGASILQSCSGAGHSADASADTVANAAHSESATLRAPETAVYNGNAITGVTVDYSEGWCGEPLSVVTYHNNVNAGTATATATLGELTATLSFTIEKAPIAAPERTLFTITNESIRGKADGTITGLNAVMEISADGEHYETVSGELTALAAGVYYVRYPAPDNNHSASSPVLLEVAAGRALKITFKATGTANIVKELSWNATLTDIPAVPHRAGYDKVAPYWDRTVFTNITADITVNAVYTLNSYTIVFVIDGTEVERKTVTHGSAITAIPEIPTKAGYDKISPSWDADLRTITKDMTVTAIYTKNPAGNLTNTTDKNESVSLSGHNAQWKETILTEAERTEVAAGENVKIYLESAVAELTDAEKAEVNALLNGHTVGSYLTVSLYKKLGNNAAQQVGKTSGALTVTLQIPADLLTTEGERSYQVIALRDGKAAVVDAVYDAASKTLSLETDDFNSVYTLSYRDASTETPDEGGNSTVIIIVIVAGVAVVGGAVATAVVIKKKKTKKA
ncbi:MAG: hypothetical protein E7585_02005 [Ruminococcaceae bacterium]|nr:hypothetical protein [Oscillospiraceae bacterium]